VPEGKATIENITEYYKEEYLELQAK